MDIRVIYTKNAEKRIKIRKIDKRNVEICLRNPEVTEKGDHVIVAQKSIKRGIKSSV